MFAMLTLAFIFLPSLNVIGALYGPRTAGRHGFVWGFLIAAVSGIWFVCVVFKEYGSIITIMVEGSDAVEKFIIWGGRSSWVDRIYHDCFFYDNVIGTCDDIQ